MKHKIQVKLGSLRGLLSEGLNSVEGTEEQIRVNCKAITED